MEGKRYQVTFINVYSPCDLEMNKRLWEEVKNIRNNSLCHMWCTLEDFNCVRYPNERIGEAMKDYWSRKRSDFNQLIKDMRVEEIPFDTEEVPLVPT